MYMAPWKCTVTGAKPNAPQLAVPRDPVWCEYVLFVPPTPRSRLTQFVAEATPARASPAQRR